MTEKSSRDLAADCREVAAALDELPEGTPRPTHVNVWMSPGTKPSLQWLLFGDVLGEQLAVARTVVQSIGGDWTKRPGDLFRFEREFHGVKLGVTVNREAVCRRVVTGTETVTKTVPDPAAPMVEVTEQVEQVEWECVPLLTRDAAAVQS